MKIKFKKIVFYVSIIFSFCFFASFIIKKKECDRQALLDIATTKIKKFVLIKDYPFSFKKKKKNDPIEYSKQTVMLNRGITYRFYAVKNEEFEGVPIVYIYNNEKQEFLLGSTYNTALNKFYDEIKFECKSTGNYCLSFCFQDGLEGCGLGVFSSNVKE